MPGPNFEYVQSRLGARHGARLSDSQWRRLAGTHLLGGYLQGIRRTSLESWVLRLSENTPEHEIELVLRNRWREYVAELAGWPLAGWQPAVAWVDRLWDLPVALELCRGGGIGSWARGDPVYSQWVSSAGANTDVLTGHLGPAIVAACRDGGNPLVAWRDDWHRRWPRSPGVADIGLNKLADAAQAHAHAMAGTLDMSAGRALRAELEGRFSRLFRAYARTPVAVFAHLGLLALDVEKLRAALLQRCLYPAELVA
jgi:hypothetical protein